MTPKPEGTILTREEVRKLRDMFQWSKNDSHDADWCYPHFNDMATTIKHLLNQRDALMRVADAAEDVSMAIDLPGNHCELEQAAPRLKAELAAYSEAEKRGFK